MNIIDDLNWRYATKEFDTDKKVSDSDLEELLESIRLAPSSYGLQPWHIEVITDNDIKAQLRPHSWNQSQITDCSHLLVLCAKTDMDEAYIDSYVADMAAKRNVEIESLKGYRDMMINGVLNGKSDDERLNWMKRQVYIALGFLMSTCAHKHIDSCPMEGFDPTEYDKILGLTEKGLTAAVVCPVGYRSDADTMAAAKKIRWSADTIFTHR